MFTRFRIGSFSGWFFGCFFGGFDGSSFSGSFYEFDFSSFGCCVVFFLGYTLWVFFGFTFSSPGGYIFPFTFVRSFLCCPGYSIALSFAGSFRGGISRLSRRASPGFLKWFDGWFNALFFL